MKAVIFWTSDALGRPDGWPKEVRDIADPKELKVGEVAMTDEELQQRMVDLTPVMDEWNKEQEFMATYDPFANQRAVAKEALATLQDDKDLSPEQLRSVLRFLIESRLS